MLLKKDINKKFLGHTETICIKIVTHYAHTGCQADASEMLQEWMMVGIKLKISTCFVKIVTAQAKGIKVKLLKIIRRMLN
jgi:hypothetical protein